MMAVEGVEVIAICDLDTQNIEKVQQCIAAAGRPAAAEYTGVDGWKALCERDDIDLVYICTDWLSHTPMAVYAMEHGKHAATEVPAAVTVAECWQLVNTAEKTRRHCIMLENCCYDKFELATLSMAQAGLLGEVVHVEGAYIHDLRDLNFNSRRSQNGGLAGYWNFWRKQYNSAHTGNPYPTHGLGPVCQILNIHRGDRMNWLVSVSTNQFGMTAYARARFGENAPEATQPYALGDMNTTLIKTQKGKTIMIQHDVTSPRPYNRLHTVSGTRGFAQKYPSPIIALEPEAHTPLSRSRMDSLLAVYEHPFYKEAGKVAAELGAIAHGGMDYIMDYRLVYCLRHGLPLDEDVYDAAEWSCLVELTELSARNNGAPVEIPDFTRGAWDKIQGLKFAE
jgi:predicted dehydrogenase